MNLVEALDAALPEISRERLSRSRPPQLDPDLVTHETVLDGEPVIGVLQRGKNNYYRFSPSQWELARLFDGERSYEEVAEIYSSKAGTSVEAEQIRAFVEQLDAAGLCYETHQEKNLAMRDKLLAQRGRRAESKINFAHISFSAWDPDRYLNWLDGMAGPFIYSRWCVLSALLLFAFESIVVVNNWHSMGPDTALFFNFAQKSLIEFGRFWILILIVGFLHESAHGLTCKHYGGQVHSMGLMFLYLVPCFFVDVTESWVSATKIQRLATIIAGIWIELVVCAIAMMFWLQTHAGGWFHSFMYEFILLTGFAAVVINLNPLIKLDGYYLLTEIIEIPDLKERSTAFLSNWVQAKVLRLPVEVPIVPRRRVALFTIYCIASGIYSYALLFLVVRFSYRLGVRWFAEWAILPSLALAFVLYRSRLRSLRRVMTECWERNIQSRLRWRPIYALVVLGVIALLFVPMWRDREDAFFVIEPLESHTICAAVPGRVVGVLVQEGQKVHAGETVLHMTSSLAAAMGSAALADTRNARFKTFDSQIQGQSIGTAAAQQVAARRMTGLAKEAQSSLELTAPADGTIVTENPAILLDQNVGYGQPLLRIADEARMVRVFVPAPALNRISPNSEVALSLPGQFSLLRLKLPVPAGEPYTLPAGLVATEKYQGIKLPVFYNSLIPLPATEGNPMYGLSGRAMIFGVRRSPADRIATAVANLVKAHVW
jgi:putative peptide zinc metalloprotease protein